RVRDREGDVEDLGQGLGEQRLARPCGAEQQDVGLLQLDLTHEGLAFDPAIVVVDRDREDLLCGFLSDHVLVEDLLDFPGLGNAGGFGRDLLSPIFLRDDVVAQLDALIADIDGRASDQFLDFLLALPAERARKIGVVVPFLHAVWPPPLAFSTDLATGNFDKSRRAITWSMIPYS